MSEPVKWCTWKCKLPQGHEGEHELCLPFEVPDWERIESLKAQRAAGKLGKEKKDAQDSQEEKKED